MRKGEIGGEYWNERVMVIDVEAIFEITYKKIFRYFTTSIKQFKVTDVGTSLLSFLCSEHKKLGYYDRIVFITVGNKGYVEYLLEKVFFFTAEVIDAESDYNYRSILKIINPELHYASERRRYYSKTSVLLSQDFQSYI